VYLFMSQEPGLLSRYIGWSSVSITEVPVDSRIGQSSSSSPDSIPGLWPAKTLIKYILIRCNRCRYLLVQIYSTCFGCLSHPSSGVHQTVTTASGTGHSIRATAFCQRGLIGHAGRRSLPWYYDLYQKL